jgi:hypothetical protein
VDEGRCSRLITRPLTKLRAAETLSLPGRRVGMTAYQELSAGTAIAEQFATLHCGVTAPRTHDEAIWHRPRREP